MLGFTKDLVPVISGDQYRRTHRASVIAILGGQAPRVSSRGSHFKNRDRWTVRFLVGHLCKWARANPGCVPTVNDVFAWVQAANAEHVTSREILIANTPNKLPHRTALALTGGAYHEALHSWASCRRDLSTQEIAPIVLPRWARVKDWSKYLGALLEWTNIIEDIRIERRGRERFEGITVKLHDLQDFILDMEAKGVENLRDHGGKPGALSIVTATFRDLGLGYNTDKQRAALRHYRDTNEKAVELVLNGPLAGPLAETIGMTVQDDVGCLRVAMDVIATLAELGGRDDEDQQASEGDAGDGDQCCPSCGASPDKLKVRPKPDGNGGKVPGVGIVTCTVCGWQTEVPVEAKRPKPADLKPEDKDAEPQETPDSDEFDDPADEDFDPADKPSKGRKQDKPEKGGQGANDEDESGAVEGDNDGDDTDGAGDGESGEDTDDGEEEPKDGDGDGDIDEDNDGDIEEDESTPKPSKSKGKPTDTDEDTDEDGSGAGNSGDPDADEDGDKGEGVGDKDDDDPQDGDDADEESGQGSGGAENEDDGDEDSDKGASGGSDDDNDQPHTPGGDNPGEIDGEDGTGAGGHDHDDQQHPGNKDWDDVANEALTQAEDGEETELKDGNAALEEAVNETLDKEDEVRDTDEAPWRPYDPSLDDALVVGPSNLGRSHDASVAEELLKSVKAECAFLRSRLRTVVHSLELIHTVHGVPKGRNLSSRYLVDSKVALMGGEMPKRAYCTRGVALDMKMAAAVVLDESSSMYGQRVDASRIMVSLVEPLDSLDCPTLALGFRDGRDNPQGYSHYMTTQPEGENVNDYHRFDGVIYDVFKGWDERFSAVRWRFANTRATGGTPMADGIQYALQALNQRGEAHRFLFIVTDGCPNDQHDKVINRQIRVAQEAGIHVVGVGLGLGASYVQTLFPDHVWSMDIHKIPKMLVAKLNELVDIRGSKRGCRIKSMG